MRQPADGAHATDVAAAAAARLTRPGLVVITGAPGSGRTTTLRRIATALPGPVHTGGALTALRHVPAFPLSHALRVRLPTHDVALLAEATRSRVRHGLLVLDDLQWADPATVAALPAVARHCRVVVALRTPHPLPAAAVDPLRDGDALWLALPALDPTATADLIRRTAPGLDPATVTDLARRAGGNPLAATALARRAGGNPLAATALARHRTTRTTPPPPDATDLDQVSYAVAAALADLTRPARTALAALGLLGRSAPAAALGDGVAELATAGLVTVDAGLVTPVSPYQADVAAGLLDAASRRALHRRLADLVTDPLEAARHLAAAGDTDAAYQRALTAATDATTGGARADALLFACGQPPATAAVRLDAARAALATGRPRHALTLLDGAGGAEAAALRAEALLQAGELAAARAAAADLTTRLPGHPAATSPLAATADRVLLLADLAVDPAAAARRAAAVTARHGATPTHVGLRAALAAVAAADRTPGWEHRLAGTAAAAAAAGDVLTARWSAWQLVETLTGDGRLTEAAHAATAAAAACAADLAYSWQTRFLAARLWCLALRGDPSAGEQPARDQPGQVVDDPPAPTDTLPTATDALLRAAADLTDRTLPATAHRYATATAGLLEADGGLLAAARARLAATATTPPAGLLDWVAREAAWLDGQPDKAAAPAGTGTAASPLVDGLRRITAHWAAHDTSTVTPPPAAVTPPPLPAPVAATLAAWSAADPRRFGDAAAAWPDVSVREQVRCLLAQGLHEADPHRAVPALLTAERIAARAGLVVLLGRCRRALRRHAVRRDDRGARGGDLLTGRERDVLRLVAQGEPTRRIAGQLGISTETVETHVRAGMRKLGARTRTEAAALAMETDR